MYVYIYIYIYDIICMYIYIHTHMLLLGPPRSLGLPGPALSLLHLCYLLVIAVPALVT